MRRSDRRRVRISSPSEGRCVRDHGVHGGVGVGQGVVPDIRRNAAPAPRRSSPRAPGPGASVGVGGIQGRVGPVFLERGDDRGRVAGPRPSISQTGRRRCSPRVNRSAVSRASRHRSPQLIRNPLVVERPASLLVVVRDLDVPEDGGHCSSARPSANVTAASAGSSSLCETDTPRCRRPSQRMLKNGQQARSTATSSLTRSTSTSGRSNTSVRRALDAMRRAPLPIRR